MGIKHLAIATGVGLSLNGLTTSDALALTFTRIADTSSSLSSISDFEVRLNDGGTVAFRADLETGGSALFTGSGGALTTIAQTSGSLSFPAISPLFALNEAGTNAP